MAENHCVEAPRIRTSAIWQQPGRKGKHLKLFLLLQVFWLHRVNARVGQVLSGAGQGLFFFPPSLHGLISVFLLLGRRVKYEKTRVYNTGPSCPAQGSLQKSTIHFTHCTLHAPVFWTNPPFPGYFQIAYLLA